MSTDINKTINHLRKYREMLIQTVIHGLTGEEQRAEFKELLNVIDTIHEYELEQAYETLGKTENRTDIE